MSSQKVKVPLIEGVGSGLIVMLWLTVLLQPVAVIVSVRLNEPEVEFQVIKTEFDEELPLMVPPVTTH